MNEVESGSLQIRPIYAGRQADTTEIWEQNHHEEADLGPIKATRGSLLPSFSKIGWQPFLLLLHPFSFFSSKVQS